MSRHKDCGDGEQVVGKLSGCIRRIFAENQEPRASLLEDGFEQLDAEPCKSVAVHNHNFFEFSREREFQKGLHSLPLEVDPRADVGDDSVMGVMGAQILDLSLQVFFLMRAADTRICNLLPLRGDCFAPKHRFNGFNGVETLAVGPAAQGFKFSVIGPSPKGCGR